MLRGTTMTVVVAASLVVARVATADSPIGAFCEYAARGEARIGNGTAFAGNVTVNDSGGVLLLGRNTTVASDATAIADTIIVGNGSSVPALAANTVHGPKASVGVPAHPSLPVHDPFCPIAPTSCGGASIHVGRGQTSLPLTGGPYGDVTVENGGTLVLMPGAYQLCSLRAGRHVTIDVRGPGATSIAIKDTLRLENGSVMRSPAGAPPATVEVAGSSVKLGADVVIEAFLSAPEARVTIGRAANLTGRLCGDRIIAGRNVVFGCAEGAPTTTTTSTTSAPASTTSTSGPVPTTSSSTTTTPTTTPTTSSSSTQPPFCGNNHVEAGEECDDGNDVGGDGCTQCMLDPKVCGANGLTVELTLDYDEAFLGGVSAAELELTYSAPLSIPGSNGVQSVRERVTRLLPDGYPFSPRDEDSNTDGTDDLVRVVASAPIPGSIQPGQFARVQFDCPAGTEVRPGDLPCVVGDLTDPAGNPFDPQLHDRVRCVVAIGATAPTTTTIATTTSTTSAPTPTTTTTLPPLCGNSQIDAGEECDDGNTNDDDGCTNSCTICGNAVITAPESCDSTEVGPGLPCPANCRIEPCQPTAGEVQAVTITASRGDLDSIRFTLDYPDGRVALGGGVLPDVPPGTFTDSAADVIPFDLEHAVNVVVSGGFPFETATITTVHFLGCTDAPLPAASDYKCIVVDASVDFQNVTGVTCSVSIPTTPTTTPTTSSSSTLVPTTSLAPTTSSTSTSSTSSSTAPPSTAAPTTSSSTTLQPTTSSTSTLPTTSSTSSSTSSTSSSTAAPTTSSTVTPTTSSTTSTTTPAGVACSANGLDVTVSIQYPEQLLGGVSAILLGLGYQPPLVIPGSNNVLSVRQSVTNLAGGGSTIAPSDKDTNADQVDDRLDVQARASTTGSIQPAAVFRARFTCAAGSVITPSSLVCTPSQASGLDGLPFMPDLASLISCSVALSAP